MNRHLDWKTLGGNPDPHTFLFDRRGDRDLRRAGMCVLPMRVTNEVYQKDWAVFELVLIQSSNFCDAHHTAVPQFVVVPHPTVPMRSVPQCATVCPHSATIVPTRLSVPVLFYLYIGRTKPVGKVQE
jgi:hypothetical protein